MIVPSKIISLKESTLSKTTVILDILEGEKEIGVLNLYYKVAAKFDDINEYIIAVDILYVLGKIEYSQDKKVVIYAKGN